MPTFRGNLFTLTDKVSRVSVRSDFIECGDSDPRKGERRGNDGVVFQSADANGRGGLGVYDTARMSLEAWIYTWGFFCVCVVLCN